MVDAKWKASSKAKSGVERTKHAVIKKTITCGPIILPSLISSCVHSRSHFRDQHKLVLAPLIRFFLKPFLCQEFIQGRIPSSRLAPRFLKGRQAQFLSTLFPSLLTSESSTFVRLQVSVGYGPGSILGCGS